VLEPVVPPAPVAAAATPLRSVARVAVKLADKPSHAGAAAAAVATLALALAAAAADAATCCLDLLCQELDPAACAQAQGVAGYCRPGEPCGAADCDPARIGAIASLKLVRATAGADLVLTWQADPAADRYHARYVLDKEDLPVGPGDPGVPDGTPTTVAEVPHPGAATGPAGEVLHYQVAGDCGLAPGACCIDCQCRMLTAAGCAAQGGFFYGAGTPCVPDPCPCAPGACCLDGGGCVPVREFECQGMGFFAGRGSDCTDPELCRPGACCIAGACREWAEVGCDQAGGAFLGRGVACDPDPCTGAALPCCLPDTTCEPLFVTDCLARGGESRTLDCLHPCAGACCLAGGGCRDETGRVCRDGGGAFAGEGTSCAEPGICALGACCVEWGCIDVALPDCPTVWLGEGSRCALDPCVGACCLPTGECILTGIGGCQGEFRGLLTTCDRPCGDPGACCLPAGGCEDLYQLECRNAGGRFGTLDCAHTGCQPFGACCTPWGCEPATASQCQAWSGRYLGDGTSCVPDPC
jgi:hypothetical protein